MAHKAMHTLLTFAIQASTFASALRKVHHLAQRRRRKAFALYLLLKQLKKLASSCSWLQITCSATSTQIQFCQISKRATRFSLVTDSIFVSATSSHQQMLMSVWLHQRAQVTWFVASSLQVAASLTLLLLSKMQQEMHGH